MCSNSFPYLAITSAVCRWSQSCDTTIGNCSLSGRNFINWSKHRSTVIRLQEITKIGIIGFPLGNFCLEGIPCTASVYREILDKIKLVADKRIIRQDNKIKRWSYATDYDYLWQIDKIRKLYDKFVLINCYYRWDDILCRYRFVFRLFSIIFIHEFL